jgi:hypothetical protein
VCVFIPDQENKPSRSSEEAKAYSR